MCIRLDAQGKTGKQRIDQKRKRAILLKAAGTPMMRPLPLRTLLMETLLPGESSINSMSGIESPTLTMMGDDAWNERLMRGVRAERRVEERAVLVRAVNMMASWGKDVALIEQLPRADEG
jgi:hypothetical protein